MDNLLNSESGEEAQTQLQFKNLNTFIKHVKEGLVGLTNHEPIIVMWLANEVGCRKKP